LLHRDVQTNVFCAVGESGAQVSPIELAIAVAQIEIELLLGCTKFAVLVATKCGQLGSPSSDREWQEAPNVLLAEKSNGQR
jgi:hypothetical protein